MKIAWCLSLTLMAGAACAAEDPAAKDKKEVESLVRGMFSRPIRNLELPSRKNAASVCKYLEATFLPSLINHQGPFCSPGGAVPARYPFIGDEDLSEMARSGRVPKFKLAASSVIGDRAVVKVNAPVDDDLHESRSVYFLKKTEQGWRVVNMLSYRNWPLDLSGEFRDCRHSSADYGFALPPKSESDFEDLPPACKALELDDRRRNGWGK